jgi:hypothetical protein
LKNERSKRGDLLDNPKLFEGEVGAGWEIIFSRRGRREKKTKECGKSVAGEWGERKERIACIYGRTLWVWKGEIFNAKLRLSR